MQFGDRGAGLRSSGSTWRRWFSPTVLCLLFGSGGISVAVEPEALTFEQHIRPIFRTHCYDCHGATEELRGALDLRLVRFLQRGGDSGPAIVPGTPDESFLLVRLRAGEMPPGDKKVSGPEIALIERWITAGAKTARPEPESIGPGLGITAEERNFWSFQPIRRPVVGAPALPLAAHGQAAQVRTAIDALILQTAGDGAAFAPDADRHTLIKRAYLNLLGLPPDPAELQRWLSEAGADWYDRLLTELLASPHYGERWGRHWLDVVGYADSEGYTATDAERPWAWKYRDWVIRAMDADKPFDRFITEQLAGDELAGPRTGELTAEQIELYTATGYLRMAADGTGSGANDAASRNQVMADTLKIVGTSLLGLSLQCAQCHDHRYDPIPHTDYFALRAVFEPALDWQRWQVPNDRRVSLYTAADRQRAGEVEADVQKIAAERGTKQQEFLQQALEQELLKFEEPLRAQLREACLPAADKRTNEQKALLAKHPSVNITPGVLYQYLPKAAEELKKFDDRINQARATKPSEEFIQALIEPPSHAPETKLFYRGDFQQPKQVISPAALTIACPDGERFEFPLDDATLPTTGRRLAFAHWLTNPHNPLFARVIVNRVWMHHFGKGLVETPADFGKLGTRPSHPELLDWLADEFRQQGWSLKALHRLIMSSTAWRQDSAAHGDASAVHLLRKPLVRLEAEAIRDRMLAASGQLDRTLFGPPIAIKEDETGQVIVDGAQRRRSLYIQARRSRPVAMLQSFDAPVMETNCERRSSSTVATQSLMLLNGEFILDQAAKLAERATREARPLTADELAALPPLPTLVGAVWQYGYGQFDEPQNRTGTFNVLPHWTNSQWQGGATLPDPGLGYVLLHAAGGHPDVPERSAIRRWIAPASGTLTITGSLSHGSENGDGVRGRIVAGRAGKLGEWTARNNASDTSVTNIAVEAGDTLDFITDCLTSITSDSFGWPVTITLKAADKTARTFVSQDDFRGPAESREVLPGRVIRAWELALCRPPSDEELQVTIGFLAEQLQTLESDATKVPSGQTPHSQLLINLCQTLLCSNEFLYVD